MKIKHEHRVITGPTSGYFVHSHEGGQEEHSHEKDKDIDGKVIYIGTVPKDYP